MFRVLCFSGAFSFLALDRQCEYCSQSLPREEGVRFLLGTHSSECPQECFPQLFLTGGLLTEAKAHSHSLVGDTLERDFGCPQEEG